LTLAPTRLVLLGHPVAHSLSPLLQNAALRAAGIDLTYACEDVAPADLGSTLARLAAVGGAGNITVPHKEAAARACDRLTPVAQRVGAVNTFWSESGALVGDNTDVGGFQRAVAALRGGDGAPAQSTIGVLGAGGGAAAVLAAIADWDGCTVRIWNRTADRAARLCARFPAIATRVATPVDAVAGAALVVHASTIGLTQDEVPIDPRFLAPGADVVDLVYRRGETPWVRAARAAGHRAVDGLPMLIEQGALAFERWFGRAPDRAAMWAALRSQGWGADA
jgi:shikimate dehydrogenase